MAHSSTVANPFTREPHQMRRDTLDTKWVSSTSGYPKAGRQQLQRQEISPALSQCPSRSICPTVSFEDVNDSITSTPVSSTGAAGPQERTKIPSGHINTKSKNATSMSINGAHITMPTSYPRGASGTTAYPAIPSEQFVTKSHTRTEKSPSTGIYKQACQVYKIGPKGEGQKIWKAVYRSRHDNERPLLEQVDGRSLSGPSDNVSRSPTYLPPPNLSYPISRKSAQTTDGSIHDFSKSPSSRRTGSKISNSSGVLNIGVDRSIQSTVDLNKPLPCLPESLRTTKASCSLKKASSTPTPFHWWKTFSDQNESRKREMLKAKISYPQPIASVQEIFPTTVEVRKVRVHELIAHPLSKPKPTGTIPAPYSPQHLLSQAKEDPGTPAKTTSTSPSLSKRAKSKQKSYRDYEYDNEEDNTMLPSPLRWRDKSAESSARSIRSSPGKSNRDSDLSFACVGVHIKSARTSHVRDYR